MAVAKVLEWVLRGCFRVQIGHMSYRSCSGEAEGTCESELDLDIPDPVVAAAAQHCAASGATVTADTPAAAPAGLVKCCTDGLGSLVLLCHGIVKGVTAALWHIQQQEEGQNLAVCCTAGKHQVALLNTCLKLLIRLAFKAEESDPDEQAAGGGTLDAAGTWWAVQTAAAIAAFGATLARSAGSVSSSDGGSSTSSKEFASQAADLGWSLAARGLLFVSQHLAEGCCCSGLQAQEQQELLGSVLGTMQQLKVLVCDQLLLAGRPTLSDLSEQVGIWTGIKPPCMHASALPWSTLCRPYAMVSQLRLS